jgi:hypothetical protein
MELNKADLCQFIEIEYGLYYCEKCETKVVSYDSNYPILVCPTSMAFSIEHTQNSASISGSSDNQELCTNDQILKRLNICNSCEFFNSKQSVCDKCGCFLSKQRQFINKLALSKASCPVGKWGI